MLNFDSTGSGMPKTYSRLHDKLSNPTLLIKTATHYKAVAEIRHGSLKLATVSHKILFHFSIALFSEIHTLWQRITHLNHANLLIVTFKHFYFYIIKCDLMQLQAIVQHLQIF